MVVWPLVHRHDAGIPTCQEPREISIELQAHERLVVDGHGNAALQFEALVEMPQLLGLTGLGRGESSPVGIAASPA